MIIKSRFLARVTKRRSASRRLEFHMSSLELSGQLEFVRKPEGAIQEYFLAIPWFYLFYPLMLISNSSYSYQYQGSPRVVSEYNNESREKNISGFWFR